MTVKKVICRLTSLILIFVLFLSTMVTYATEQKIIIYEQPEDCYALIGDNASFHVEVAGNQLSYRWYYSKDGGSSWNTCQYGEAYRTSTLTFSTKNYQYGYQFRCLIKDKSGNSITTDEVTLKQIELDIVKQPISNAYEIGEMACFSTVAKGNGVSYRWYYSKDKGATWNTCQYGGYKTDNLTFEVKKYQYGYQFRCLVKDRNGTEMISDEVTLEVPDLEIIEQPKTEYYMVGDTTSFCVNAKGVGVSYRWYYSKDQGTTWNTCQYAGYKTNNLAFQVKKYQFGYQFRCVVKDEFGNTLTTNEVELLLADTVSLVNVKNDKDFESIQGEKYTTLVTSVEFAKKANIGYKNVCVEVDKNTTIQKDDILLLRFTAYAQESCGQISIAYGGTTIVGNYPLPVSRTDYILPISGVDRIDSIKIELMSTEQKFHVGNFELVNCGTVVINDLRTGMFDVSGVSSAITVEENEGVGYAATDIVTDGQYLYSIYKGTLLVYTLEKVGSPKLISTLDGLGNSREIAVFNNGTTLAISARENGVYFVDVTDKKCPSIILNLDTLGLATGIDIEDQYCFVCSRNFGVEIFDISDLTNPRYCSQMSANEEFYDCYVDAGHLYVSVWAQRKVRVYNLANIYAPQEVSVIGLDGCGGGCVVRDNLLYVATGYHSVDERSKIYSPGYGMGNGLEIYDVSDPTNPILLSRSKIDGRYFFSGFDHWRVEVAGDYAYLSSAYNGLFIYDISNPKAPIRTDKVVVNIPNTSPRYRKLTLNNYLYTFDTKKCIQGIISSVAVADGCIYFSTENGLGYGSSSAKGDIGLYALCRETAKYEINKEDKLTGTLSQSTNKTFEVPGYVATQYATNSNIYAVVAYNGKYYCAAGLDGIQVLNQNMELIGSYPTIGAAKDIKCFGNKLYVAESNAGLGIYTIENNQIVCLGRCNTNAYNVSFSSLAVFSDGKSLLAQAGWTRVAIIDVSDPEKPTIIKNVTTGTMYYRNLSSGLLNNEYIGVFDRNKITWYGNDADEQVYQWNNSINTEPNGTAVKDSMAITIWNNGYVYYEPATTTQDDLNNLKTIKVPGAKYLKGKPIINGNLMIVSFGYGKQITLLNISDIDNPVLIAQFDVEGNPDIATFSGDEILVPLRHGGILKLQKNNEEIE